MSIIPLGDRVLIKPDEVILKTQSGVYLPERSAKDPLIGTVLASSSEKITPDMKVLFWGSDVTVDENYLVEEKDVLAIIMEVK